MGYHKERATEEFARWMPVTMVLLQWMLFGRRIAS